MKRNMQKCRLFILAFVLIFLVSASCSAGAVSIMKDGTDSTGETLIIDLLSENPTLQLSAVLPEDSQQGVTWRSSEKGVATVSKDGLVTGLKKGTATITATSAGETKEKATCKVKVANLAKTITISGDAAVVGGKSATLKAEVLPKETSSKKVSWESSDPEIATVSSEGRVKTQETDTAKPVTIAATAQDGSGAAGTWEIMVRPAVQGVSLRHGDQNCTAATLLIDLASGINTLQIGAAVAPADADQSVTWKSSKKSVVSVSEDGLATGLEEGTATITATSAGNSKVKATCDVKVTNLAKEIKITGKDTVVGGKVVSLNAEVLPEGTSDKALSWTSSDTGIAVVSSATGVVLANQTDAIQTVTVTATAKDGSGVSAAWDITVRPAVQEVALQHKSIACAGETLTIDLASGLDTVQLNASASPAAADQALAWYSSDQSVASVSADGLVTGLQDGTATVTAVAASDASMKAACDINVTHLAEEISIAGDNLVVGGMKTTLIAAIEPIEASNQALLWESSNPEIAAVTSNGVVTTQNTQEKKTVTITAAATDGSGISADWTLIINPAVQEVSILQNGKDRTLDTLQIDLTSGPDTLQLDAEIFPADADQAVMWQSSDESIATVSEDGIVTGLAKGTATISATSVDGEKDDGSEIKAFCQINVVCRVSKLTVTGPDTLYAGETGTYTATILPEAANDAQIGWTLWHLIGVHDDPRTPKEIECDGWELCSLSIATAHNNTNVSGQVTVNKDITEIYTLLYRLETQDGSNLNDFIVITVVPN